MVRSRALSKERVFYCIYKIDSFRAIVCKTYLFTGSLSVFELFFYYSAAYDGNTHRHWGGHFYRDRKKLKMNEK